MIPQVFWLGPIPLNSFGLMVALAMLAAIYRLGESYERNGIAPQLAEKYVLVGGFVGLAGSRIWYILEHFSEVRSDLLGAIFASSGFTFYGGFILSTVVLILLAKRDGLSVSAFLDSVGPALALGYAIGRLGCQLSGDGDYGIETTSIFGMSYSTGVIPTAPGVKAFPTPLYESTMALVVLYVLTISERRSFWNRPFQRFGAYLALIGVERFIVEFIRINPKLLGPLSEAQIIALAIIASGLVLCNLRLNSKA